MFAPLIDFLLDESKWLPIALLSAIALAGGWLLRAARGGASTRERIAGAMSLLFAGTIGVMGVGHLLAITLKLGREGLTSSFPVATLYAIGAALVVPTGWLAATVWRQGGAEPRGRLVALNVATAVLLVALGPHNAPLAVPGVLNVVYLLHRHRAVGWTAAGIAGAAYTFLLVGGIRFFLSGQSFEQFSGL